MSDITMIPVIDLHPHPDNPRKNLGDLTDLANSIKAQGIRQNLLVVPMGKQAVLDDHAQYTVVIGHRRLAAAKQAGLTEVPCAIAELDAQQQLELMIIENSQRTDLLPIEEADAYQGLLDLGLSALKIAKRTGRSTKYVRSRLKVAGIPEGTRNSVKDFNQLSLSDLAALAEFTDDPDTQAKLAETAGTQSWDWTLKDARRQRQIAAWSREAQEFITHQHLTLLPKDDQSEHWWDISGYEHLRSMTYQDGPLRSQWEHWVAGLAGVPMEHDVPNILVFLVDGRVCLYLRQPDAPRGEGQRERRRRILARERAANKPVKDFDETSRELRLHWVHDHLHDIDATHMLDAINALTLHDLMGYSTYGMGALSGADYEDRVIQAYNQMTTPLPVTEKDTKQQIYHLGSEERNLTELRARQAKTPRRELLFLLIARAEAMIIWGEWTNPNHPQITDYYSTLHNLGYPVSDEEQRALDGGFAPTAGKESDHE